MRRTAAAFRIADTDKAGSKAAASYDKRCFCGKRFIFAFHPPMLCPIRRGESWQRSTPAPYSAKQLAMIQKGLREKTLEQLVQDYNLALEGCKLAFVASPPHAMNIQRLVQLWKELNRRKTEEERKQVRGASAHSSMTALHQRPIPIYTKTHWASFWKINPRPARIT
jgi:hypothetical protein